MSLKQGRTGFVGAALCIFFCILLILIVVPKYLNLKIENRIAQGCPTCQLQLGSTQINPFNKTLTLHSILFASDESGTTVIKVIADTVETTFNVTDLINSKFNITKINLYNLQVKFEEKYNPKHPSPKPGELDKLEASYGGKWLEDLPEAKIENINIENGSLEYTLKIFGKDARISVSKIYADISTIATRKGLGPRFINAKLRGILQKSGIVNLHIQADLFSVKNEDQIEIDVQNQNMSELNSFFLNEDGIEMSGEVNQAHTVLYLRQGLLTGKLSAKYNNLLLHVLPTPETGKFEAAMTDFIQKLEVAKTKPAAQTPPPLAEVAYERRPGQGLIKFILQGLKEAAFKVISN